MFGFININKPSGMTSHSVIYFLRKITGIKQIGHAGTLDPLASGVLPVAVGKASKLIDYLDEDKEYVAGLKFGFVSDTYDTEGKVERFGLNTKLNICDIESVIPEFLGIIKQIPPAYSAVHYNGKRLYEMARAGKIPDDIPVREVNIYKNEIVFFDEEKQELKLQIACSKGTYIRTIVHDIGQRLGTGAVMCELTRVKSSGFRIENSLYLSDELTKEDIKAHLINPIDILNIANYELNDYEYEIIKNGNKFKNRLKTKGNVLLVKNGNAVAISTANEEFIQPKKLLFS